MAKIHRAAAREARYGYLFIAPFFVGFGVFGLYPIAYSLYLSFVRWDGLSKPVFVGVANYVRLVTNPYFLDSILNTFIIWIISIVPELTIALLLALILNEKFVRGKHLFRAVFYFPNIVTPVTIGVLASLIFAWKTGSVNQLLTTLHIVKQPVHWLGRPFIAQVIVASIMAWQWFGFNMLIYIAGLQSISDSLYDAAAVDGASKPQIAIHVTIPILRPVVFFTVITSVIGGMQIFGVPLMIGSVPGNATDTMVVFLYKAAFKRFQYGFGSSVAYGIFVLILFLSLITFRFRNRRTQGTHG